MVSIKIGVNSERQDEHAFGNGRNSDSQHGIVCRKLCLTHLIEIFDETTKKIDEDSVVNIVYWVISKVFDKRPHGRLMLKVISRAS